MVVWWHTAGSHGLAWLLSAMHPTPIWANYYEHTQVRMHGGHARLSVCLQELLFEGECGGMHHPIHPCLMMMMHRFNQR
jgi:hypothetical protein